MVDPTPLAGSRNRCLVCGREWPTVDFAAWRDEDTGRLIPQPSGPIEGYLHPDGTIAACCNDHDPGEARTAFVLAERTLVPAVFAPPQEEPCS